MKKLLLIASVLATGVAMNASPTNINETNYQIVEQVETYSNVYNHIKCTVESSSMTAMNITTTSEKLLADNNIVSSGYIYMALTEYDNFNNNITSASSLEYVKEIEGYVILSVSQGVSTAYTGIAAAASMKSLNSYTIYWTDTLDIFEENYGIDATKVVYASYNESLSDVIVGITVFDDVDGDLTSSITIEDNGGYIAGQAGTYTIKLSATDSSDNKAYAYVSIIVIEDAAPTIVGTKLYTVSNSMTLNISTITETLSAVDFLGNDLTASIELLSDAYTNNSKVIDTHEVKYAVTDTLGKTTEFIVEVKVIDLNAPVFLYDETFTVYVAKGTTLSQVVYDELLLSSYELQSNTTAVKYDDSQVNYSKTGTYTIDFEEYAGTVRIATGTITVVVTGTPEGKLESAWLNLKFWFTDYKNQILTVLICAASFITCLVVHIIRNKTPKKPNNSKGKPTTKGKPATKKKPTKK